MGFQDVDKCKQALVESTGDIMSSIEDLVGGVLGVGVSDLCRFAPLDGCLKHDLSICVRVGKNVE